MSCNKIYGHRRRLSHQH